MPATNDNDDGARLEPRRVALKLSPPELVVEFFNHGRGRLYLRRMKLTALLTPEATATTLYSALLAKHPVLLDPSNGLSKQQVERLLDKIVRAERSDRNTNSPKTERESRQTPEAGAAAAARGEVDLCKMDDATVSAYKAAESVKFEQNRLRPGDDGYVYDKQVEFEAPTEDCGWDSD